MIAFSIYLLIFVVLIYSNGFFKLFKDEQISNKTFSLIFILKAMAVPAFYFLFVKLYGGIENFDAGKFYFDAKIMNHFAYQNFPEYLKMLFGLQDAKKNIKVIRSKVTARQASSPLKRGVIIPLLRRGGLFLFSIFSTLTTY